MQVVPKIRFIRYPGIYRIIFPQIITSFPREKGKLFLSFDDGPDPETTPLILNILKDYNVKAIFFCLGENIEKYPDLFSKIKEEGHAIGNHGYKHLNGWKISLAEFIENVEKGFLCTNSFYFRPAYGKLTFPQYKWLRNRYKIICWDVMSYDFDLTICKTEIFKIVSKYTMDGSIVVCHDNLKAKRFILNILPILLMNFIQKDLKLSLF